MNIGVGCHFLLQGIFLIQGLNLCLLHWQAGFFVFVFLTTEPPGKPFKFTYRCILDYRNPDAVISSLHASSLKPLI